MLAVVRVLAGRRTHVARDERREHVLSAEVTGHRQRAELGGRLCHPRATGRPGPASTLQQQTHLEVVGTFAQVQAVESAERVIFVCRLRFVPVLGTATQMAVAYGSNATPPGQFHEVVGVAEYSSGKVDSGVHICRKSHLFIPDVARLHVHGLD